MTTADVRPPIPECLAHRPTVGGLVKPWINVELADGGVDFRAQHHARTRRCLSESLCQVCGRKLYGLVVLLGGPKQLAALAFDEPPLHPECSSYAVRACPMLAGRQTHYAAGPALSEGRRGERCGTQGCDCGGWIETPGFRSEPHAGEPAHPWLAVYTSEWAVLVTSAGVPWGARPLGAYRVRELTR